MGNASAKHTLGLPKLAQIYHRILSLLLNVYDRIGEPNRSNDTIFEGYVDMKEGKGKGSLYDRKARGPRRVE